MSDEEGTEWEILKGWKWRGVLKNRGEGIKEVKEQRGEGGSEGEQRWKDEGEGSLFNGLMRPSSSQLFCVRHALTFRSARELCRLIFHILAITLTLEALADSRLRPFHSVRASSPNNLDSTPRTNLPPIAIRFPHKICSPHSAVCRVKFEMCASLQ